MLFLLQHRFYRRVWYALLIFFEIFFLWQGRMQWPSLYTVYFFSLGVLFSLLFTGFAYMIESAKLSALKKEATLSGFGLLIAILILLCPVCNVGLFLAFGIALQLQFLSPYVPYLAVASLAALFLAVWLMNDSLTKACSRCVR